jgi:hypothetical protein
MVATVQTKKAFSQETGIGITKINELIASGDIPVIPQQKSGGLVLINKLEFDRRVAANQFTLPIPKRGRKQLKEIQNMEADQ